MTDATRLGVTASPTTSWSRDGWWSWQRNTCSSRTAAGVVPSPRQPRDVQIVSKDDDQQKDGGRIDDDPGIPAALMPRDPAPDHAVQNEPVADHGTERDRGR